MVVGRNDARDRGQRDGNAAVYMELDGSVKKTRTSKSGELSVHHYRLHREEHYHALGKEAADVDRLLTQVDPAKRGLGSRVRCLA